MNNDIVIALEGISQFRGGKEILHVPSFSVQRGEIIAVTGPNGSGKSTLLKTMGLLERPDKGRVLLNGLPVEGTGKELAARRNMAMVFQDPLLLKGTVIDNVTIGLKLRGMPKAERLKKAEFWLAKFNIMELKNRDVRTLSGGEAQRVNLARAFVLEPEVLFLDEPFTYLDASAKADLTSDLKVILGETSVTALLVNHDFTDIPYLADRIVVLMDGRIYEEGSVEEVFLRPRHPKTARFLGMENIWPGNISLRDNQVYFSVEGTQITINLTDIPGLKQIPPDRRQSFLCIRPEFPVIKNISEEKPGDSAADCCNMTGEVQSIRPFGYYYKVKVALKTVDSSQEVSKTRIVITTIISALEFHKGLRVGTTVLVSLPYDRIHIIQDW